MALTVDFLLACTTDAQRAMSLGLGYSAANEDEGWGVVPERKDDRLTGRIGVICDDTEILKSFIDNLRERGHRVDVPRFKRPKNIVFVTLKAH